MNFVASLTNLGGPDLIIILLIILVLFGAKKLPELARGMGSAIKEFQKAKSEFTNELESASTDLAKNQPGVQKPAATVPRIENAPPQSPSESPRDVTDRSGQV
jgi:sec-independent protein translocase protein TatA